MPYFEHNPHMQSAYRVLYVHMYEIMLQFFSIILFIVILGIKL